LVFLVVKPPTGHKSRAAFFKDPTHARLASSFVRDGESVFAEQ